jgi:hypothetical protein
VARLGAATRHGPARNAQSQERPLAARVLDDRTASEWGLQPQEWARYRELMDGPLGIYSPNLDPLSALGIEARTDEERRRYAELQVQVEARRVEKLLAYQRAYDAAWQRLNPGMQRVNLPGDKPALPATRGSGRWRCSSRTAAPPAGSSCSACNPRARSSTCTWSAAARTTRASATGPSARRSTRRACAPAASRSTTTGPLAVARPARRLPAAVREVNGQWQRQP